MATHRFEYKPPGKPPIHGFPDPPRRHRRPRDVVPSKRLKAAHRRAGRPMGLRMFATAGPCAESIGVAWFDAKGLFG